MESLPWLGGFGRLLKLPNPEAEVLVEEFQVANAGSVPRYIFNRGRAVHCV